MDLAGLEMEFERRLSSGVSSIQGLPSKWRLIADRAKEDSKEADVIRLVYLHGFESVLSHNGPSHQINTEVVRWVRDPRKSLRLLISMDAVFAAAYLERFLKEVACLIEASPWEDVLQLWSVSNRQRTRNKKKEETLGEFLNRYLQPTAEDGGKKWVGRMEKVFGEKCDKDVAKAVVLLIEWRNRFVHSMDDLDSLIEKVSGETLKSWKLSIYLLVWWVARAGSDQQRLSGVCLTSP
jgi:hypothetical protein